HPPVPLGIQHRGDIEIRTGHAWRPSRDGSRAGERRRGQGGQGERGASGLGHDTTVGQGEGKPPALAAARLHYGGPVSIEDLPLTAGDLNLDTVSRKDPHLLQRLAGDASVRALTVRGTDVVTTDDATDVQLHTRPASDLPGQNDEALWAYLGTAGERSYLARLSPATGQ